MHVDYVEHTTFQDNEIYYFYSNTSDEDYDFKIYSCILHPDTVQDYENNLLPSRIVQISECDYNSRRPIFGWLLDDVIKQTFLNTTQYSHIQASSLLKNHYKSPLPKMNLYLMAKPVATHTM